MKLPMQNGLKSVFLGKKQNDKESPQAKTPKGTHELSYPYS